MTEFERIVRLEGLVEDLLFKIAAVHQRVSRIDHKITLLETTPQDEPKSNRYSQRIASN